MEANIMQVLQSFFATSPGVKSQFLAFLGNQQDASALSPAVKSFLGSSPMGQTVQPVALPPVGTLPPQYSAPSRPITTPPVKAPPPVWDVGPGPYTPQPGGSLPVTFPQWLANIPTSPKGNGTIPYKAAGVLAGLLGEAPPKPLLGPTDPFNPSFNPSFNPPNDWYAL